MVSSMAMKYRKLFPIPTLTATNQTDCTDFCDPSCPDSCYQYADVYFMAPPPPPPPPPLSTDPGQQISSYVIIIVVLLASFFLVVSYYMIIVKYCSGRNRLRRPPAQSDGRDEEFVDENTGPAIDHPIWYINTVGLQSSIINLITVFKYKKGDPLIEGSNCAVCLSEFQEDETLRLLPKCNHAFHIPCIDTWLRSHTNCPLCRAGILSNTAGTPASNDQNSLNLTREEEIQVEIQVENSESDGELGNNCVSHGEVCENRGETEAEVELSLVDEERKDFDVNLEDKNMIMEDEIQPVRRSVSMDYSSAATIRLTVANFCMAESEGNSVHHNLGIVQTQDRANSRMNRAIGSPSIAQSLHKSPVSMKRSFSCAGRLFLSRYNRNPSSILPL